MVKRVVSWEELEQLAKQASYRVNFVADYIVAILRGGLIPAYLVSNYLSIKNILILGIERKPNGKIRIYQPISTKIKKKEKVLVVSDIVDSGETLKAVAEKYKNRFGELHFLTLFCKGGSFEPEFYAEEIPKETWICFPWEKEEAKRYG